MTGIYFSGTGNTKYCVEAFLKEYEDSASVFSIEDPAAVEAIKKDIFVIFAYPVYYSNLPKIVRDFILCNKSIFHGKDIFIIATMGLFSGDGAGCSARLLSACGAKITGGLHLKMPDCIGDEKILKKTAEQNKQLVHKAEIKIKTAAAALKNNDAPQDGLGFICHAAGLFGQRLWFYGKTRCYSDKLKINAEKCSGCGLCAKLCPLQNLTIVNGKAHAGNRCTMCYRCVNNCPRQAMTLLGKKLYEQCRIEKYL